jgi:hypothetical protein
MYLKSMANLLNAISKIKASSFVYQINLYKTLCLFELFILETGSSYCFLEYEEERDAEVL